MKKSGMKIIIATMAEKLAELVQQTKYDAAMLQATYKREDKYLDEIEQMKDQLQTYRNENNDLRLKSMVRPITEDELLVLLHGYESPINRIKIIRQITGLGLKEAKTFYDLHLKEHRMTPVEKQEDAE